MTVTRICTATTASGRPCKAQAGRWPRGVDGDPQLCGRHLPVELRETRDAGFVELERRHVEFLAARSPECWSWPQSFAWDDIAAYYGGPADDLKRQFEAGEEQAVYIAFAAWHNDRCAVCGFRDPRMIRDHDHDTGLVRGLLCRSCNGQEPHDDGLFGKYRDRPPTTILGIQLRYYDARHGWREPRALIQRRLDNHSAYALAAKLGERLQTESELMTNKPERPRPPIPEQVFLAPSCGAPDEATLKAAAKKADVEAKVVAAAEAGPAQGKLRRVPSGGVRTVSGGAPSLGKRR